jgi:hypothetical protein
LFAISGYSLLRKLFGISICFQWTIWCIERYGNCFYLEEPEKFGFRDIVLTPSVVGLLLACHTVGASFLFLLPAFKVSRAGLFGGTPRTVPSSLSPAYTVLSRNISVLHFPLNGFMHKIFPDPMYSCWSGLYVGRMMTETFQ